MRIFRGLLTAVAFFVFYSASGSAHAPIPKGCFNDNAEVESSVQVLVESRGPLYNVAIAHHRHWSAYEREEYIAFPWRGALYIWDGVLRRHDQISAYHLLVTLPSGMMIDAPLDQDHRIHSSSQRDTEWGCVHLYDHWGIMKISSKNERTQQGALTFCVGVGIPSPPDILILMVGFVPYRNSSGCRFLLRMLVKILATFSNQCNASCRSCTTSSAALAAFNLRRRWDSNPRGALTPNGFQDRRLRPLSHSSVQCR